MTDHRPDPLPCPICGADIDPTYIDNEHAIFGTDPMVILENIPEWGCFAIPGFTHSFIAEDGLAVAARGMYAQLGKGADRLAIQHAWTIVRATLECPFNYRYALIPQRLREGPASPLVRQPGHGAQEGGPLGGQLTQPTPELAPHR